jgi:hypothetical protein
VVLAELEAVSQVVMDPVWLDMDLLDYGVIPALPIPVVAVVVHPICIQ